MQFYISKSKYLEGLKCPKLLWMHLHTKEKFPPIDPVQQAVFDEGHRVGKLARLLYPDGVEIGHINNIDAAIQDTKEALRGKKPIYEACILHNNALARADILVPLRNGAWDLIEVKSSTSVKDEHVFDLGFQKYCYEGAGIKLNNICLAHVNNTYTRGNEIDVKELFVLADQTIEASEESLMVAERLKSIMAMLEEKCPDIRIGTHCEKPHECPLIPLCWAHLPEQNLLTLNRFNKETAFGLMASGTLDIKDLKDDYPLNSKHRIQKQTRMTGKAHIDPAPIKAFLDKLQMPLYFMDFETVDSPIPIYEGTRPYQKVPFQFSLHIMDGWDTEPRHYGYLADGAVDPRPEFLQKLKALLGDRGTILAYRLSFETGVLKDSVAANPEYSNWLEGILKRTMDLLIPFGNFDYYDPKQLGSASIKRVYPALAGGSYEGMKIGGGELASKEYARVTFGHVSENDKREVRAALEEYCSLDTLAMIKILFVLKDAVKP